MIWLPLEVGHEALAAIDARLKRHLYGRAKALSKDSSGVAEGCDVSVQGTGSPALENPAGGAPAESGAVFSLASEEEVEGPREAIVAWDLTLRCPVCNSSVTGNCRKYHCYACERRGR